MYKTDLSCDLQLNQTIFRDVTLILVPKLTVFYPASLQSRDVDVKIDTLLDVTCISNVYSGGIISSGKPLQKTACQ